MRALRLLILTAVVIVSAPTLSLAGDAALREQAAETRTLGSVGENTPPKVGGKTLPHDKQSPSESENREVADLEAQNSMATSAERMLLPSWIQAAVALLGTIGLVASLAINLWSMRQTRRALEIQSKTAETQLRPYIGAVSIIVTEIEVGKEVVAEVRFQNFGSTPAYKIRETMDVSIEKVGENYIPKYTKMGDGLTLQPGATFGSTSHSELPIDEDQYKGVVDEQFDSGWVIIVHGTINYEDKFGKSHKLEYSAVHFGPDARTQRLFPGLNSAT